VNLRASDDDPDSVEASAGMPDGSDDNSDSPDVAQILRERVPTADDPPPAGPRPAPGNQPPPGYQQQQPPPGPPMT
jgi:hypothetical protein